MTVVVFTVLLILGIVFGSLVVEDNRNHPPLQAEKEKT